MMRLFLRIIILLTVVQVVVACTGNRPPEKEEAKPPTQEQLVEINREMVIKERERIESYITRKNLEMTCTETGLWYAITEAGSGEEPGKGTRIVIDYDCSLLDGTLCYSSDADGSLEIIPGKTDIPPGLDEGVRFLSEGSEALFILPSYLAYGLTGDRNKIPSHATLVYKVKVVKIY